MKTTKLYHLVVVVRPNDQPGPECLRFAGVQAESPLQARREVLELAWASDLLVSYFVGVISEYGAEGELM